jgi:long-chain acyl-CoA synthetase
MFSYTSGTTGDPKGVKLTHKMILGSAWAAMNHVSVAFHNSDSYISYLPAAHSFEQCL